VEIVRHPELLGRSAVGSIQSGLYYGTLAMVRALAGLVARGHLANEAPLLIGTAGFGRRFEDEGLLDVFLPELPLRGLCRAHQLSQTDPKRSTIPNE
jgi:type III pantothenate kinase